MVRIISFFTIRKRQTGEGVTMLGIEKFETVNKTNMVPNSCHPIHRQPFGVV
jgi:hypothetical protein